MRDIASGESKYLDNKEAITNSRIAADAEVVRMATSVNPFNSILKLQALSTDGGVMRIYKVANGYMARFNLFEFMTAQKAIKALRYNGDISKKQATGLLIGVTARMTAYMALYTTFASLFDSLFGADDEEEIDLDEVIKTLKEMEDDSEESEEEVNEEEEVEENDELEEAYATIESLQKTINEVNLLNAKLLFTNKLFRTFDLNENQKVKVLENFDRTSSVREVKLVFSTLAENLNVAKKKRTVVKEGYASKATKSSAPKKIISEGNDMAARWKKLAGLK